MVGLEKFLQGCIECAVWSSIDEDGTPLDSLGLELDAESREELRADCKKFMLDNDSLLTEAVLHRGYSWERAGHDYWLTRNGHGAGFWDREELKEGGLGERLTESCRHDCAYLFVSGERDSLCFTKG